MCLYIRCLRLARFMRARSGSHTRMEQMPCAHGAKRAQARNKNRSSAVLKRITYGEMESEITPEIGMDKGITLCAQGGVDGFHAAIETQDKEIEI